MAYTKQNFTDGQVLEAEHLNHIENGIVTNEAENSKKLSHDQVKTINGQSLIGNGNITVSTLSATAINTLISVLLNGVYVNDQSENITLLKQLLESSQPDESIPDEESGIVQVGSVLMISSGVNVTQSGTTLSIS